MFKQFCTLAVLLCCAPVFAQHHNPQAPIGVMGNHTHEKGEWMFSYRFMTMEMEGSRDGNSSVSSGNIVTSEANRFAPPANLRVVPTEMSMDMHMLGAMYGLTDRLTVMLMANYLEKDMDHVTFMGMAGDTELGNFRTDSGGLGDTQLTALYALGDSHHSQWTGLLGVSIPTGDVEQRDTILTPMGTRPEVRLPYPMQLGSGSYDAIVGLSYTAHGGPFDWGAQWKSTLRTERNDEGYSLGDEHMLQGWLSNTINRDISLSARLSYLYRGNIDGIDDEIALPVQTADPDRQGLERIDLALGLNVLLPGSPHQMGVEISTPLSQDLEGPQLETDWVATIGWQYAVGQHSGH